MRNIVAVGLVVVMVGCFIYGISSLALNEGVIDYLRFAKENEAIQKEAAIWEKKLAESQIPPEEGPTSERLEELSKLLFEEKPILNVKIEEHNKELIRLGYDTPFPKGNVPKDEEVLFQIEYVDNK